MATTGTTIERHYGMDWLRIGAFGLLIFYHIGMYFVPWDWHVKAPRIVDWATYPMLATNSWRLALLFAVSGFASAALLGKARGLAFLGSRTLRLLIPLIFAMIVIIPPQPWVELMFKHGYAEGYAHFWANDYFRFGALAGLDLPTWQHLWFVAYLWTYSMLLGLLTLALPGTAQAVIARAADRALTGPQILVTPAAWFVLVEFVLFPGWQETHGLFDDIGTHAIYFPIFLFGLLLWRAEHAWAAIRRWWPAAAALSLAGFGVVCGMEARWPGNTPFPDGVRWIWDGARIAHGWGAIVALIGIADRWWNRDARIRPMLTEAIFPFYIIHQTIIVLVGWWLLPAALPNWAVFAILVAATVAGCWLFYLAGRAVPPLRPLIGLNWRKKPGADRPGASLPSPLRGA